MIAQKNSLNKFRLLATFLAGRPLSVVAAPAGKASYTDGRVVYVSPHQPEFQQRQAVILHSMLLGAGSLDHKLVKAFRGRSKMASRYLALEGARVLFEFTKTSPLNFSSQENPLTTTPEASLEMARSSAHVDAPPEWFGAIRPSELLSNKENAATQAISDKDFQYLNTLDEDTPEEEEEETGKSTLLGLLDNPLMNSEFATKLLAKLLGTSSSKGDSSAGEDMPMHKSRQVKKAGSNARPLPIRIHFTSDQAPEAVLGVGGAHYPEWDIHADHYRPGWCRVIDYLITETHPDNDGGKFPRDDVLRARLSRIGLGPKICRRQPDGNDLDLDALIDLSIDLASGNSASENIHITHRKLSRDLGVFILLDASGSASEFDPEGLCVHEHQQRAAATIAATLEDIGDRVALYACRSYGREAVHLLGIKPFSQQFSATARNRLKQLEPDGYTRLGAAIRHAGEILKKDAGTPNRLLLVLSDGVPYDHGYEAQYAEADARKALEELRTGGVACLCLSLGASTSSDSLERVFGSASYASAPLLSDLSPRMDEYFITALKELSSSNPRTH